MILSHALFFYLYCFISDTVDCFSNDTNKNKKIFHIFSEDK